MKNLEEKIKILNQNRLENSLYDYVYCESQSDPNFFRWLFEESFDNDFDSSLNDEQKEEFKNWLEELKQSDLLEKWIVVRFPEMEEDGIRVTRRSNFETMNFCDAYDNYGQKVGCYHAGCYSLENSASDALKDLKQSIFENFGIEDISIVECNSNFEVEPDDEIEEDKRVEIDKFIENWRENNEHHAEITGWTYHDSHNFKTVVLSTEFGEPDCVELDDDEQIKILLQMPETTPYIEKISTSEETEDYIFSFDRWATNSWFCYVEIK